jgi:hypothetical protein
MTARVPVTCTGTSDASCTITLVMRTASKPPVTLGKKTTRLEAGHRRLMRIDLNAAGRHLLQARQRLSARLTATQAGNSGIAVVGDQWVTFEAQNAHG